MPLDQTLEKLAARLDSLAAQIAPVEPEKIERRKGQARGLRRRSGPGEPLLQRGKGRPARVVDHACLPIDDALARGQARDAARDRTEAVGPIVPATGIDPDVAARLAREEAVAVVLDLEEPVVRVAEGRDDRGQGEVSDTLIEGVRAR